MSTPVPSRPLSLVPFLAADAVLLGTAVLIAWRTPEELAGGPLLGVILCTGLGAVLGVLPFILNDAREREASLAERQHEWAELVTNSTASASRWGAQWAAAATGLEDATKLASRSIAVAEQLPGAFQEKVDALTARLDKAEAGAQATVLANEERANRLAAEQVAAWAAGTERLNAIVARVEQALAGREQADAGVAENLRTQHAEFAALLAELPAAAARVDAQRAGLEERVAAAPVQIETAVGRVTSEAEGRLAQACAQIATQVDGAGAAVEARLTAASAEAGERLAQTADAAVARLERASADAEKRLGATTDALAAALKQRMGEVETALGAWVERLKSAEFSAAAGAPQAVTVAGKADEAEPVAAEQVIATPVAEADSVEAPIVAPVEFTGIVDTPETEAALVIPAPEAAVAEPAAAPAEETVAAKRPAISEPAPVSEPVVTKPIMDPFYIPKNGYSALADAMDLGDA